MFGVERVRIRRLRQGFTLLEIIIVGVILAILVAASVPRFQQSAEGLRAQQTALSFQQLFRYAHQRAAFSGTPVVWVWDQEAQRARLAVVDERGESWLTDRAATSRRLASGLAVRVTREGASTERITFFPDGTCDPATMEITYRDRVYVVSLNAATSQISVTTEPLE